jgi:O-antigen/teichoic acid export membrane protein
MKALSLFTKPRRTHRRTTKWNLIFNYISIALGLVSGVALIPLYLRYIPLELYGVWLAIGNLLAWLTVIDPGLSTVLQQRAAVAYAKKDWPELNALLTGGVLISATISVLVTVCGLTLSKSVINSLNLDNSADRLIIETAFLIAVLGSAGMIFYYALSAFCLGIQSSLGIGIIFTTNMIIGMITTVVLLYKGMGLLALPIGTAACSVGLIAGFFLYVGWRYRDEKIAYRFSTNGIASLIKLTSYTFFGRSATVLASNMDAFVLTRYMGPEVAPIFLLTRKASDVGRMFLERPALAFMPVLSSLAGASEDDQVRVAVMRLMRMILWFLGLAAAGFIVFNDDFVNLWVGEHLYAGAVVNLVMVVNLVFGVLTTTLSNLCFSIGNIRGNSIAALVQGFLSIPLMIIGAKFYGLLGVAVAPLLAVLSISAWYYPCVFRRLLRLVRLDIRSYSYEAIAVTAAAILTSVALFWLTPKNWPALIFSVVAFSATYLAVLTIISHSFRGEIAGLLNRRKCTGFLATKSKSK